MFKNLFYKFNREFQICQINYVRDVHGKELFYSWMYGNYKGNKVAVDACNMYMMGNEL